MGTEDCGLLVGGGEGDRPMACAAWVGPIAVRKKSKSNTLHDELVPATFHKRRSVPVVAFLF